MSFFRLLKAKIKMTELTTYEIDIAAVAPKIPYL
jgi:hypothetical protein